MGLLGLKKARSSKLKAGSSHLSFRKLLLTQEGSCSCSGRLLPTPHPLVPRPRTHNTLGSHPQTQLHRWPEPILSPVPTSLSLGAPDTGLSYSFSVFPGKRGMTRSTLVPNTVTPALGCHFFGKLPWLRHRQPRPETPAGPCSVSSQMLLLISLPGQASIHAHQRHTVCFCQDLLQPPSAAHGPAS